MWLKPKEIIKKIELADYLFLLVIALYLTLAIIQINTLISLPSPIYGGDYYLSRGVIEHYIDGGSAFLHSAMKWKIPIYSPLYTILAGSFGKIPGLSAFLAMKYFNILFIPAALTASYLLFSRIIKNKFIGLGMSMIYLSPVIVFKYLQFTIGLMIPLVLLMLYLFFKKRNYLYATLSGIAFGLMGISHSVATVFAFFIFFIFSIYILIFEYVDIKDKLRFRKSDFLKNIKKNLLMISLAGIIAISIAMLYWYQPIFVYHGKTINPIQDYSEPNFDLFSNKVYLFIEGIKSLFFNFSSPLVVITSVLAISGLIFLIMVKKPSDETRFIYIILISGFVSSYSYFLGVNLVPSYLISFSVAIISPILIGFSTYVAIEKLKKYSAVILIVFLLLSAGIAYKNYSSFKNDRWTANGKMPLEPHFETARTWVKENTDVNTVFLSTNELSFALNGLTGRKFVSIRLPAAGGWTDDFERMRDSATILYGNNDTLRKELIKKYDIKYLYWNYYWIQSEMQFDEQGRLAGFFDPLIVYDTNENREYLTRLNITFYPQYTWLDPGVRNERIKKFNILYILPKEMNFSHPWSKDLDPYLEEAWNYTQNGVTYAKIYKIKE